MYKLIEVNCMKGVKPMATFALILLMAMFALSVSPIVSAQGGETTVVIYDSIGGTTDPPAGTTQMSGTVVLTATPDAGFEFAYWLYVGPDIGGHGVGGTTKSQWTDNPMTYNCAEGYTVEWQAVFVPTGSSSLPSSGIGAAYVVAFVVIAAAVAGVAAFAVGRRSRK
jgi:hypothetical protein